MDNQSDGTDDAMAAIKEVGLQLETRVATLHNAHINLIASVQTLVPGLVSSLDLSLKVISSFNNQPFSPIPKPLPPPPKPKDVKIPKIPLSDPAFPTHSKKLKPSPEARFVIEDSGGPLYLVRAMVAVCLLQRVPFEPISSSTILRKLENDQSITVVERAALRDVGGGSGSTLAVDMALRSMKEDNGGLDLEESVVSGKLGVLVMSIDTARLLKELPPSKQNDFNLDEKNRGSEAGKTGGHLSYNGSFDTAKPPTSENWTLMSGTPFRGEMGTRVSEPRGMVGIIGVPRGVGVPPPMPTLPTGLHGDMGVVDALKPGTGEDDLKNINAMLSKRSYKEMQKFKTAKELTDLINRPTAKEIVTVKKFQSKGGSQVKEYCTAVTKEDCRRQAGSYIACEKLHYRRIIALHTDTSLGDCSYLDTCRHMKTCKSVHYELDPISDPLMMGSTTLPSPKPLMPLPQRAHYCSQVELGEAQWINCDIRSFRMDILGQFGVIMADPPWDIHMALPYGTMADNEMRTLNVPALQTDGLIFLWVTGRAMELGRECLELWGYTSIEEIIWVKTNQLQRIIRTGRTGHWLNHSKEHCLVGIKGNPEVNRNIDTDVIVAEVRETSRKPDEMYSMLERIMPRARKVELFARTHNCQAGWMSLGNQLNGVRLVDEGLRARFKAAYPDVKVQPSSPPRSSAGTELNPNSSEPWRNNALGEDEIKKPGTISNVEANTAGPASCAPSSQEKSVSVAVEMTS